MKGGVERLASLTSSLGTITLFFYPAVVSYYFRLLGVRARCPYRTIRHGDTKEIDKKLRKAKKRKNNNSPDKGIEK